jgi:hypothetical protein
MDLKIGSSSGFASTQMANSLFKKADTNGDGGIDKTELNTMMANGPGGTKGTTDIDTIFSQADSNSDGKIDQTENADQLKKIGEEMKANDKAGAGKPQGGGGPPPAGGGGGDTAQSTSSSSDSNKTYDPKDANKDGTVSFAEETLYAVKHPDTSEASDSSSSKSGKTDAIKSAVSDLMDKIQTGKKYSAQGNTTTTTDGTQSIFSLNA